MLLGIAYKNFRIGVVAFAATVVPVVCGFGLYGFLVDSIGLAAAVIVAVAVGVVIDDAIHLVYRFQDGRINIGLSPAESAAYSIHRAGAPIVTTTVVLVIGFAACNTTRPFERKPQGFFDSVRGFTADYIN